MSLKRGDRIVGWDQYESTITKGEYLKKVGGKHHVIDDIDGELVKVDHCEKDVAKTIPTEPQSKKQQKMKSEKGWFKNAFHLPSKYVIGWPLIIYLIIAFLTNGWNPNEWDVKTKKHSIILLFIPIVFYLIIKTMIITGIFMILWFVANNYL